MVEIVFVLVPETRHPTTSLVVQAQEILIHQILVQLLYDLAADSIIVLILDLYYVC